jgi:hypothetical protein
LGLNLRCFTRVLTVADVGVIGGCTNVRPDSPSSETVYTLAFVGEIRQTVQSLLVTRSQVENYLAGGVGGGADRAFLGRNVEKMFNGKLERGVVRCHDHSARGDKLWTVRNDVL